MTVTDAAGSPPGGADRVSSRTPEIADCCLPFHGGIVDTEETWTPRFFATTGLSVSGGCADEVTVRRVLAHTDRYITS